jgi:uncharacterized delta-60 repeat protein
MRLDNMRTALGRTVRVGIFSLVLLALVLPAADAAATRLWVKRYDGTGDDVDEAAAVAFDSSGNVYVAGRSKGAGTQEDLIVIKYTAGGIAKWVARYDGPVSGWDGARAIAVDEDGYVYVTGRSRGSGTWDDFVTIKYSSSGAQIWARRYSSGAYNDEAVDIAIDPDGNVIVTGVSAAKDSGNDYFTIKYRPGGTTEWTRRYDGPIGEGDKATGVAVDSEGNVYVTGASMGDGTNWDYCTIKYNPDGTQLWVKRWDSPKHNSDGATGIAIDENDVVYVTGYSYKAGDNADYVTICYRKGGSVRWTRRYDGPAGGPDVPWAIAIDSDSVYVTGASYSNTTGQDYATVRYLLDGTQEFVRRYSSTGKYDDVANDVAVGNGRVYVTGFSNADLFTIAYGRGGRYKWSDRYNGPAKTFDQAYAIGVCPASGNVYATGGSGGIGTKADVATIKYAP